MFIPVSRVPFSDQLRSEVTIQAIPFVTYFAAIILLFVLMVALTAKWLHLSIPFRTHRAVELTTIAGISGGDRRPLSALASAALPLRLSCCSRRWALSSGAT